MRSFIFSILLTASLATAGTASARNIVITNDDGLTSNVVALYKALKKDGHDVIVSVPCRNQSGMGAALNISRPLTPLSEHCLNNAAKKGDPAAGQMSRNDLGQDFHYVNSTPVVSLMYGLDVLASKRWQKEPDLVLSGPNEGQNVGAINLSSGTVSAAQYAAIRGIPAIALSAGGNTEDDDLANPASAMVGSLSAELVKYLDDRSKGTRVLPTGIALNVNFPDKLENAQWKISRIGTHNAYSLSFLENIARDAPPETRAMAQARGMTLPELPGLSFGLSNKEPTADQQMDEAVVYKTAIAVSPMQAGYGLNGMSIDWLDAFLNGLTRKSQK